MPVLDRVEADLVGRAVDDSALDAAACHPDREAVDVVVAAIAALRAGVRPNSDGEKHDRVLRAARALQILEQAGDRFVDGLAVLLMVGLQAAVGVPHARAPGPVLDLDKTHAAFHEPPRSQQLHAEIARGRIVEAVELLRRFGFVAKFNISGTDVCMRKASS